MRVGAEMKSMVQNHRFKHIYIHLISDCLRIAVYKLLFGYENSRMLLYIQVEPKQKLKICFIVQ